MNNTESPTKRKNKLKITNTARALFIENGITSTTIIDIAKAAKVERKTIYNYFSSKEIIAQFIFKNIIDNFVDVFDDQKYYDKYNNGFEKINVIFKQFVDFLFDNEEDAIYLIHYDYYFRDNADTNIVTGLLTSKSINMIINCWNQGVMDGSIDISDKNSNEVFQTIMQGTLAYISRFFLRGHIIQKETGIGIDSVYTFLSILLNGVNNTTKKDDNNEKQSNK